MPSLLRTFLALLLSFGCFFVPGCATTQLDARASSAIPTANAWLRVMDSGAYKTALQQMEFPLKALAKPDVAAKVMTAFRAPLGRPLERKIVRAEYYHTLPGLPDGDYANIIFNTRMEHKQSTFESVALSKTKNVWHVTGYHIK